MKLIGRAKACIPVKLPGTEGGERKSICVQQWSQVVVNVYRTRISVSRKSFFIVLIKNRSLLNSHSASGPHFASLSFFLSSFSLAEFPILLFAERLMSPSLRPNDRLAQWVRITFRYAAS